MKNRVSIIFLSIIFIYTLFGFLILPNIIKSQVQKNLNEMLIANVTIKEVKFNPFTFKLKIFGFEIKDKNKELIKFSELYIDFSILKSLHKTHISFKQVKLTDLFVNVVQNKDGSINLLSLLKEKKNKSTEKKSDENKSIIPFKITKTILDNANINIKLQNGNQPIDLNFDKLNYTFYELGTYKNSLASHSLNTVINKETTLLVNGGFHLIPFKMYGKVDVKNLKVNDYLPYVKDLLKFETNDALINFNLGYQVDLSNELKLQINKSNFELKNLNLSQNKKEFAGLKSLEVKDINLLYPQQTVSIKEINVNDLFANAIINKQGELNFANLLQNQDGKRLEKVKEKRKIGKDIWNVELNQINLNHAKVKLDDYKSKSHIKTKDINLNLNQISLIGTKLNLKRVNLNVANISLNDNKNPKDKTAVTVNKLSVKLDSVKKNKEKINIRKINIKQPYVSINNNNINLIAKNLDLNIYDVLNKGNYLKVKKSILNNPRLAITVKKKKNVKKENVKESKKSKKVKKGKKEASLNLDLGPFKINKANISFQDKNLPIPFKTNISKLNGDFSELITKSSKPTKLKLEGQVDRYGYTKITGFVDHKNIKDLTDIKLLFKNIAIKNFTPYSGKFVGRELIGGKLNLNLNYNIKKSNIKAKNSIVITDIKLGKPVESPTAMSLPLELAIALMEDTNGVIDLNIPISGNVDDPKFSIAPIVWKAFSNLIVKAITSPFRFLAALFDFDEEEIKSVEFAYGNSQLIASEKETLDKIAQIFRKRPNIALKVQATFNSVLDKKALQTKKFEILIDKEIKLIKKGDDKYLMALENNYLKYNKVKPLKELKKDFINKEAKKKEDKFNKDAYVMFFKEFLISKQIVLNNELEQLATKRATSLSTYLQTAHKITPDRVIINEKTKDDTKSKEWVAFDLEIGVKK